MLLFGGGRKVLDGVGEQDRLIHGDQISSWSQQTDETSGDSSRGGVELNPTVQKEKSWALLSHTQHVLRRTCRLICKA